MTPFRENTVLKVAATVAIATTLTVGLAQRGRAEAATVLAVEGILQPSGKTQTAFGGEFCKTNTCQSINHFPINAVRESDRLQDALDATEGPVIVNGWSLGGSTVFYRTREWEKHPELAPDPSRVMFVTFGSPKNALGGKDSDRTPLGSQSPYRHLEVVAQYDSVADRPARWGWYSQINLSMNRHYAYFEGMDVNAPENLVYQDGNTTHMLVPAKVLPMLQWRDWFTSDQRMAELDAKYRPLVEKDYDRPGFVAQGDGANWGVDALASEVHSDEPESDDVADDASAAAERRALDVESKLERRQKRDDVDAEDAGREAGGTDADVEAEPAGDGDADDTGESVDSSESPA